MVTKHIIGWTLIALVLLTGCLSPEAQGPTGDAGLAPATLARPSATPVSVALDEPPTAAATPQVRQTPSATPTLSPTPTRTATPTVTPTATPTALPTPAPMPEQLDVRICSQAPQQFNLWAQLGIRPLSALRFESEELVTFEGWAQRPESPVYSEATPKPGPIPWPSSRQLLQGGQLDLSNGQLSPRPLDVGELLANPCDQTCPLEVIGQSPDGQWQLVQVSDWLPEVMGLWLVSEKTTDRLVHYVPYAPDWQWAADSSLLWLVYPDPEFGSYTLVARLTDPPVIQRPEPGSVLDTYGHFLAYSPVDNAALSVPSYDWTDEPRDEVSTIPLANGLESISAIQNVPDIVTISWNDARQSFMAQVVTTNSIQFIEIPDGTTWSIPEETLKAIIPSLVDVSSSLPIGLVATGEWATSASGDTLALLPNPALLWVFDCAPSG
ncbi:MAG TPA: hypothetical protein PK829_04170 [Promineifilum sp.]|nr:hypothetical protein [Promineifilum sp.]